MDPSTRNDAVPNSHDVMPTLERVVALVESGRYAEANAAARGLSYLGLVGDVVAPVIFREGALATHWAHVRRQPALIALAAFVRESVAGDVESMEVDLLRAAEMLTAEHAADPVTRISDLTLEAFCLILASRADAAIDVARRAADLLFDLGADLGRSRKAELAPAACDLAGMFMIVDEYATAMHLWGWVRGKVSDPTSPLLAQADVGLACAAAITGGRMRATALPLDGLAPHATSGLWHAARLAAEAFRAHDALDPHAALALTREAIALLPAPYVLGPLVSIHVLSLNAVGYPTWALDFLDLVEEQGLPTSPSSALGQSRLLSRVCAHAAAGDLAAALACEHQLPEGSVARRIASVYRMLWADDSEGVVAEVDSIRRHSVYPRRAAFLHVVSAAAHARMGMDAEAVADLERLGQVTAMDGARGVSLALPRSDVARLSALVAEHGTFELQRLLPDASRLHLEAAPVVELKPRERQVLGLVASGLTNAEIAERLFISANTVKYHLTHAYRSLGVATREEAIAEADRMGQLSDPMRAQ